ncbi:hypothetical protein O9K51_05794 [Purpureocillium lavendulum]|uniref:Uncharacterized protein n=1 Tax=Purpureocillium lavendulum TaxID=1247861 RepID=A0AB34FSI9_9HYPO|nr:hypothetical protein O9K51_05794 [Purpureocillium lavendulum]
MHRYAELEALRPDTDEATEKRDRVPAASSQPDNEETKREKQPLSRGHRPIDHGARDRSVLSQRNEAHL